MKAVIDRIEGDLAVLLVGERQEMLNVPLYMLPEGATEGSWLIIRFSLDEEATNQQYRRNKSLLERLLKKNDEA
jgi:hypothetical protein